MANGAHNQVAAGGAAQPGPSPSQLSANNKAKRRVRNILLQPLLQVRIGIYCIVLSLLFAGALAAILYFNYADLLKSIVLMTDAEDEVRELFADYWKGTQLWVYLSFFIYFAATVGVSILYTHKLIGPTVAFRRHIRSIAEGRYNARTYLRKGDAFFEVADELNALSEIMERRQNGGDANGQEQRR